MNELSSFYEHAIARIAAGMDPQEFCHMVYDSFKLPIIVVDESYKLVAFANDGHFADPYWEEIVTLGSARSTTITNHYLKAGYLDSITATGEAIFVDWGVSTDYPQTSGPIFVNKELCGFTSLAFTDPEQSDEICKINTIICRLLEIIYQTGSYRRKHMRNPIRQIFARKFFDEKEYMDQTDLTNYEPHVHLEKQFCVVVVDSLQEEDALLEHVRGRIRSFYPNVLFDLKGRKLYLLFDALNDTSKSTLINNLTNLLSDYFLHAGVSDLFSDIAFRRNYILQGEQALHVGKISAPKEVVYDYWSYYEESLLYSTPDQLTYRVQLPKSLLLLQEYDAKNDTNYLRTLQEYLYQRNDLNRAANAMYMHRNTLKYRLDKIRTILNEDPDDPAVARKLEFAYVLLGMREQPDVI